jgi:uncharacterized protein (DUF885 family)
MNDVDFDRWMDEFAADCVRSKPQLATSALYFSGAEQDALDRSLVLANNYGGTYGAQIAQAQAALARRGLEELARFTGRALSGEQRTSAAVLRWNLDKIVASAEFARHRFVFNQFVGLHVALVMFLTNVHPLRNERDAENYVARLALVPELLDEGIAEANAAAAEGIVPPRFILERTIEQLDGLMTGAPADHALVATFARRIEAIRDFSTERRSAFVAVACDEVRNRFPHSLAFARRWSRRFGTRAMRQAPGVFRRAKRFTHANSLPLPVPHYRRNRSTRSGCAKWRSSKRRWTKSCGNSVTPTGRFMRVSSDSMKRCNSRRTRIPATSSWSSSPRS